MYSKADFKTDVKTDAKTKVEPPRPPWCDEKTYLFLLFTPSACTKNDTPNNYQKCLDTETKQWTQCLEWVRWKRNN